MAGASDETMHAVADHAPGAVAASAGDTAPAFAARPSVVVCGAPPDEPLPVASPAVAAAEASAAAEPFPPWLDIPSAAGIAVEPVAALEVAPAHRQSSLGLAAAVAAAGESEGRRPSEHQIRLPLPDAHSVSGHGYGRRTC